MKYYQITIGIISILCLFSCNPTSCKDSTPTIIQEKKLEKQYILLKKILYKYGLNKNALFNNPKDSILIQYCSICTEDKIFIKQDSLYIHLLCDYHYKEKTTDNTEQPCLHGGVITKSSMQLTHFVHGSAHFKIEDRDTNFTDIKQYLEKNKTDSINCWLRNNF